MRHDGLFKEAAVT